VFKTRNGEMTKCQNGEMVLRIGAKVMRYNHSNKIIEHINKKFWQTRIHFHFLLAGCLSALYRNVYFVSICYKHPTSLGVCAKYMFAKYHV